MANSRYQRIPGSARRYLDTKTGKELSRWEYQKLTKGIDFREQAKMQKARDIKTAVLRPARGRKSGLRKSETEKALIAEARIENQKRIDELRAEDKKRRAELLKRNRKVTRKHRRKKVTKALLKPGSYGAKIFIDGYAEYIQALKEARKTGVVLAYSLGMVGIREDTLEDLGITVFPLEHISTTFSEDEFYMGMLDALENYSYFIFVSYFMHLKYDSNYAKEKARRYGQKKK